VQAEQAEREAEEAQADIDRLGDKSSRSTHFPANRRNTAVQRREEASALSDEIERVETLLRRARCGAEDGTERAALIEAAREALKRLTAPERRRLVAEFAVTA